MVNRKSRAQPTKVYFTDETELKELLRAFKNGLYALCFTVAVGGIVFLYVAK
jgi:hypothetical protein